MMITSIVWKDDHKYMQVMAAVESSRVSAMQGVYRVLRLG